MDKISILIPCYNGEYFINRCFDHILHQTYPRVELIVVDDGSTDNSVAMMKSFLYKFKARGYEYKIFCQKNMGQASACNRGLKFVTGDFLVWQDIDDYYEYDALERMHDFMKKNSYNFMRGNVNFRVENSMDRVVKIGKSKYTSDRCIFNDYVFERDTYCFPGIFMVRMKYFDSKIKNRSIYCSRAGQNWQIILPLAYEEKCGYLNESVYNYVIRKNSHSHSVRSTKELLKRCNDHKDILIKTIDSIDQMGNFMKCFYKILIVLKYEKRKIIISVKKFLRGGRDERKIEKYANRKAYPRYKTSI